LEISKIIRILHLLITIKTKHMTKLEKEVANYLEEIGFLQPKIDASIYISMCKNKGWKDGLGIIDPHEIAHIRKLMKKYKK